MTNRTSLFLLLAVFLLLILLMRPIARAGERTGERTGAVQEQTVGPNSARRASAPTVVARLAAAEERLAGEPSVREVQRWAEHGGSLALGEARALLRDARRAGALPWMRLRGRFEDTGRLDRDAVGIVESKRDDTRWTAELWLEWDLAEAAAGSTRLKAIKEVSDQLEVRQAVIHQVTLAYHDRQRLVLEDALDELLGPEDVAGLARRVVRQVRIRELDATLDALTGGRWSRSLAKRVLAPVLREEPKEVGEPEGAVAPDRAKDGAIGRPSNQRSPGDKRLW